MNRILLVEDDINLAFIISEELKVEGFEVLHLSKGENTVMTMDDFKPDIVLMDVNLQSKLNGFEIAKNIRLTSCVPILFTTSRTQSEDIQLGFSIGNVDYLKKPFYICELILRINELLSRNVLKSETTTYYQIGKYSFHPCEKVVLINDDKIKLQNNESLVLTLLCECMNKVVQKDHLLKMVWHDLDLKQREASLYNIITSLRHKLSRDNRITIDRFTKMGWKLTVRVGE